MDSQEKLPGEFGDNAVLFQINIFCNIRWSLVNPRYNFHRRVKTR